MDDNLIAGVLVGLIVVSIITVIMHDRHYQSRGTKILENRVRTLEEIVSEWAN